MLFSEQQIQSYLRPLQTTALKDQNDVIANSAAALAVKCENTRNRGLDLNPLEQRLVRYALEHHSSSGDPIPMPEGQRRPYKRRKPSLV